MPIAKNMLLLYHNAAIANHYTMKYHGALLTVEDVNIRIASVSMPKGK